jgi:MFS family permease
MKYLFFQNPLLVPLALSTLLASMGTSMANVALPMIGSAFTASIAQVRWVVLAYLIMNTVLGVVVGQLGDSKGHKKLLLMGLSFFVGGCLLGGAAPNLGVLVLARVIQGMGAAALIVLPMSLVGETLPPEHSGRAIGLLASMSAIGTATGPSIGGLLVAEVGWRSVFILMAFIAVLNFYLAHKFIPSSQSKVVGSPAHTILKKLSSLLESSSLGAGLVLNAIVATVMMSTLVVGPFFLSETLQLEVRTIGLAMSVGPVVSIITGFVGGGFVDRYGSSRVSFIGLSVLLVGSFAYVFAPFAFGLAGFALSAAVSSIGYQLFQAANSSEVMRGAAPDKRGVVSGMLGLSRQVGLVAGALIARAPNMTYLIAALMVAVALTVLFLNKSKGEVWIKLR